MIYAPDKDPAAVLDYSLDWKADGWLPTGQTISAHAVTVPAGITLVSDSETDDVVFWRLSGGTAGVSYDVTVQVTTDTGQIDERTVRVHVRNR